MIDLLAGVILDTTARFRRDRAGNVAITFALSLLPVVGAIGASVDYSNSSRVRTALQGAADAAAIGSIASSSAAYAASQDMQSNGPISNGASDATAIFNANTAGTKGFDNAQVRASVTRTKGTLTATVQFSAQVPATFMKMFGLSSIPISGTSTASNGLPTYVDFYLLLDNTPSMGVGATQADINTMVANTSDQCAFACHDLTKGATDDYYTLAKKLGVTTQIDVLRTATQQLMDTASQTEGKQNIYRMAIYTFGSTAQSSPQLQTITDLTSNLSDAKGKAAQIDLMTVEKDAQGNLNLVETDYDTLLPAMNKLMPTPGSGTASSPQEVLFFVTDGVADEQNTWSCATSTFNNGRCIEPVNQALCTTIKNRGIKIAILYTPYLPLPTNDFYNQYVASTIPNVWPALQGCASPNLAFQVTPSQGIPQAMTSMFNTIVTSAQVRLTH
jgi:Flp pilus assembly protein TadG